MSKIKVSLDAANNHQLRHFAGVVLGIDGIKNGQSDSFLIGKIKAALPDATDIEVPEHIEGGPMPAAPIVAGASVAEGEVVAAMAPRQAAHYRFDPKVKIYIGQPYDGSRMKHIQLSVGGDTLTMERGKEHVIPYRFYLALEQAQEQLFQDTDVDDQRTGMPVKELISRPTVPHTVTGPMPSPEEIAAFHKRTDNVSL